MTPCPWKGGLLPKGDYKKVIIGGTSTFEKPKLLFRKMDYFTYWFDLIEVYTGGQRLRVGYGRIAGADYWGEQWAYKNYWPVKIFHADWDGLGKSAGMIRNAEIVKAVGREGFLVAFWDGSSPGTRDLITKARKVGMKVRIVRYEE